MAAFVYAGGIPMLIMLGFLATLFFDVTRLMAYHLLSPRRLETWVNLPPWVARSLHRVGWHKATGTQFGLLGTVVGLVLAIVSLRDAAGLQALMGGMGVMLGTTVVGVLIELLAHRTLWRIAALQLDSSTTPPQGAS